MDEVGAFCRRETLNHAANALDQTINCSSGIVPQQRFELCERHFDRVVMMTLQS